MARRRARARAGRRAEPYPGGGALGSAPGAGRQDPRDGAGRGPRDSATGIVVHRTRRRSRPARSPTATRSPSPRPRARSSDLAGSVAAPQLARAIEAAEYHRLLDVPSLLAVSAGRPGARAHQGPHGAGDASTPAASFEAAFVDLCDRYGLPRPLMNTQVGGFEVDAYWPEHGLVVELDSWRHHGTRAAFERDKERDAELHAHGITTLRFTYHQVTADRRWVAAQLSPSLAPRSRRGSSSSRRSAA